MDGHLKGRFRAAALALGLAAGLGGVPAGMAVAQEYPTRPVEWIVMWSAGGGADTATRVFTQYFEQELGQKVVVKNVTGAGGTIGYLTAKAASPDGYTLVSALSDLPKYVPLGTTEIAVDDFDILGGFAVEAPVLVAQADAPFDTPEEFVAMAKENPGQHTIGVSNLGGVHHQPVVLWSELAGIDAPVIAHQGSPQMNAALLGGHIDMISSWVKQSQASVESGELKFIGYFGADRVDVIPDVPTFREEGYDIVWEHSCGMATRKGVLDEKKAVLVAAMQRVWENPEFEAELNALGLRLHPRSPEEYRAELLEMQDVMGRVVEILGQ